MTAPMLPWSTRPLPHRPPHRPGVCRVCGCTDGNACIVAIRPGPLGPPSVEACAWVEDDLCSRCHSPRRPTRAQHGEIGRLRAVKGRLTVMRAERAGWLTVVLDAQRTTDLVGRITNAAPVLDVSPRGTSHLVAGGGRRELPSGAFHGIRRAMHEPPRRTTA